MTICPICSAVSRDQVRATPYIACPNCDAWFQSPLPPKVYEASHEKDDQGGFAGHLMSEHDRDVNRQLAGYLFRDWLGAKPAKTLDVGSKYPYLAHCLRDLGCEAFGMDNIEIVPEYARALGVPMLMADFEQISDAQLRAWTATEKFALITLVHVFEHMYDPLAALRKLRRLVADDGVVFIRLPDHRIAGFERDLTPGHFTIHPFFHAIGSVLELLVQGGDLFSLAHTTALEGAGQRDILLRPLRRKPVVYAGLIVKNEERDLPRCLKSIEPVVDGVVVVDTGSTDRTLDVASSTIGTPVYTQVYTGASRQDESGDWKLWDFAKARNVFVDEIERRDADLLLWMDADDELLTPANLRRAFYWSAYEVFGVQITSGGQQWTHHRLWKTGLGIRYEGRCHEYPTIGSHHSLVLADSVIYHDAAPGTGETANARNLRILLEEFAEHPTPRAAFYLANTHKDAQRYTEAVPWYTRRIEMGPGYRDEWLFAYLYKARCERAAGNAAGAETTLLEAASKERGWAEFWMELAYIAYDQKSYSSCIGYAMQTAGVPIPATQLWREPNKYTDQPPRLISWCHEHLGNSAQALTWAETASKLIGNPDADWDQRITRLQGMNAPAPKKAERSHICLNRPGAIGDILMTLNLIPALKEANPEHEIWYFCDEKLAQMDQLGSTILAAGCDKVLPSSQFDAGAKRAINLVGYPLAEGYPEKPMRLHLIDYFSAELGLTIGFKRNPNLPALTLRRPARNCPDGDYVTLQWKAGWSRYKEWSQEKWQEVCDKVLASFLLGVRVRLIDERTKKTLAESISLFANARMHIGIDSFCNHLTNYFWTNDDGSDPSRVPGVILWGSTQASAAGYPHNTNITRNLHCQPCFREDPAISRMPRGPCVNPPRATYEDQTPHACMEAISVDEVVTAIREMWERV